MRNFLVFAEERTPVIKLAINFDKCIPSFYHRGTFCNVQTEAWADTQFEAA